MQACLEALQEQGNEISVRLIVYASIVCWPLPASMGGRWRNGLPTWNKDISSRRKRPEEFRRHGAWSAMSVRSVDGEAIERHGETARRRLFPGEFSQRAVSA